MSYTPMTCRSGIQVGAIEAALWLEGFGQDPLSEYCATYEESRRISLGIVDRVEEEDMEYKGSTAFCDSSTHKEIKARSTWTGGIPIVVSSAWISAFADQETHHPSHVLAPGRGIKKGVCQRRVGSLVRVDGVFLQQCGGVSLPAKLRNEGSHPKPMRILAASKPPRRCGPMQGGIPVCVHDVKSGSPWEGNFFMTAMYPALARDVERCVSGGAVRMHVTSSIDEDFGGLVVSAPSSRKRISGAIVSE
ncbi:hypothetical protein OG21DRAFT_1607960 [Imleria badia]|nr:hypothetical protein OG21DRAFT_1607960 [Imleria badia]